MGGAARKPSFLTHQHNSPALGPSAINSRKLDFTCGEMLKIRRIGVSRLQRPRDVCAPRQRPRVPSQGRAGASLLPPRITAGGGRPLTFAHCNHDVTQTVSLLCNSTEMSSSGSFQHPRNSINTEYSHPLSCFRVGMPRTGRHGSSGRSEERRGGRTELGKRKREAAGGGEEAGAGERKQRRREEERSPFRSRYTY